MTGTCRWLPFRIASGPANMALDEALLEQVAERGDLAYLRAYGWSEPTLSLGYFQHITELEPSRAGNSSPRVRRATGGGAIWHDHELTYALVLPPDHPVHGRTRPVSGCALGDCRNPPPARDRGPSPGPWLSPRSRTTSRRPFLCFTDGDPEDIVADGFKVVGSAERRRCGAILQHGSILLRRSDTTPGAPGNLRPGRGRE